MAIPVRIGKKTEGRGVDRRWWGETDDSSLARRLIEWCNRIETATWDRRMDLYRYYRYLTGQHAYYSYNYSSVSRPAQAATLARARFTAPVKNIIGMAYSALNNRIYKNHVALQVCPDAGNDDAQLEAKQQTRYLDARQADGLWPLVEECGMDCCATGAGFLKVDTGLTGKKIEREVIKPDEIIVDPSEAAINKVRTLAIRWFVNKYEVADAFPDFKSQIMMAPPAELGFAASGTVDLTDVIVLRDGYHLGENGVRALVLEPNICLKIEREQRERFPLAQLIHMPLGFWGKGSVQDSLPLQRAHDRLSRAVEENMVRFAWPRVGVVKNSGLNEGEIAAGSSMFFHFNQGMAPEFVNPTTITSDQFRYLDNLERGILDVWGVSTQATGATPMGPEASGRARLAQDQIDDRRHIQLLQNLEKFVEDIGYLDIEAARKVKPRMVLVGKSKQSIDYPAFSKDVKIRAFPMSSIPQSIAGRQDWIDRAFAQKRISAETKSRLEGMPDIDGEEDLMSADHDLTAHDLDTIVESGEYNPPTGIGDLRAAFELTQKRIMFEKRRGLADDKLSLLFQYLVALDESMGELEPTPTGAPVAPGAPGTPGVAPEGATLPAAFAVQPRQPAGLPQ